MFRANDLPTDNTKARWAGNEHVTTFTVDHWKDGSDNQGFSVNSRKPGKMGKHTKPEAPARGWALARRPRWRVGLVSDLHSLKRKPFWNLGEKLGLNPWGRILQ